MASKSDMLKEAHKKLKRILGDALQLKKRQSILQAFVY